MGQFLPIIIFIGIIFLFGFQNMHHTRVNFPFAGSFDTPTIFLLMVCFFLGYAAASFWWMRKYMKERKKYDK